MADPFVPPADFEEKLRAALHAPEPEPAYVQTLLRRVIQAPSPVHPKQGTWLRPSLAFTAFAVLVITAVFLSVGPQKVLAAVRGWLGGYLPGFGFVDDTIELRAIPAPVRQQRDGAVLTIDQAFTDPQRTIIVIGESRYSDPCPSPVDPASGTQVREPYLQVGGVRLDLQTWQASYLTFPPLPERVDEAVLFMPFQMFCDSGIPDWAVELVFEPVPAGMLMPVLEADPSGMAASSSGAQAATQPSPGEASVQLENIVELQDGLLFSGLLSWSGENVRFSLPDAAEVTLQDSNGQAFPLEPLPDQEVWALYPARPANSLPWAYRLAGPVPGGRLALHFPNLLRTRNIPGDQGSFVLDLGLNPQPGQLWTPDLTIQAAGRTLQLAQVRALPVPDVALSFTFATDDDVWFVALADVAELSGGGGGGGMVDRPAPGQVVSTLFYRQALPSGEQAFQIVALEERLSGPWVVAIPGVPEP